MRRFALASMVTLLAGCAQSLPTFPPPPYDSGIECTQSGPPMPAVDAGTPVDAGPPTDAAAMDGGGAMDAGPRDAGAPRDLGPARPCQMGQVCLAGHCYAPCTSDAQCGDAEMCASGVCVARGGPHDGGIDAGADGGPPDMGPCGAVTCADAAAPVCYPTTGTCVECAAVDGCPGASAPVCDLAEGVCRAFTAAVCAPCKTTADCTGIMAGTTFECATHTHPLEKVCLQTCTGSTTCPNGMHCDTTESHCIPNVGACTTWHAAATSRACTTDANCAPLGATGADFLFTGMCASGHCHQPCGTAADCQMASQTCPGSTVCM